MYNIFWNEKSVQSNTLKFLQHQNYYKGPLKTEKKINFETIEHLFFQISFLRLLLSYCSMQKVEYTTKSAWFTIITWKH
jgi:hypothetical protein